MRQCIKSASYNDNRNARKAPTSLLSQREMEFLTDILRLKNDNHNWDRREVNQSYSPFDHAIGKKWSKEHDMYINDYDLSRCYLTNKMSKELSDTNPKWSDEYQQKLKSRILRKSNRLLADAELLKSAVDKLRRL
jgi:hypothetical protein